MPKLILSMDGLVLKEIPLDKERIAIGRKPNNDIQIDNLAISGQHALITTILDDSFLEDQNSTNGTYVNGQSVKKCVLHNNDVIELGKYRLKFIADNMRVLPPATEYVASAVRNAPAPVEHDQAVDQTQVLPSELIAGPGTEASFDATQVGVIHVLSGPNAGRRLELAKALTTLGKPGKQVAVITRRPHGYFISHVEGGSFPLVNGRTIEDRAHPLNDGDIVEIAGVKMAFSLSS